MFDSPAELLARTPSLRLLLEEYAAAQKELRERSTEETKGENWVPRLRAMDGIATELLPQLHGRLIALGFVKFQLTQGALGLEYQISPLGRRALGEPMLADQGADAWADVA